MAKKTDPNQSNDTLVFADQVAFRWKTRSKADPSKWEVQDSFVVKCDEVPDQLVNGDDFASMKAYGIRAFLCDRSSDFRKYGAKAYFEAIQAAYASTLAVGVYKAQRESKARSAGLDPLLVQAIADMKRITPDSAIASLKALSPEQLAGLKKHAAVQAAIQAAREALAEAEAVDLTDLAGAL